MAREYSDSELQQVQSAMVRFNGDISAMVAWKREFEAQRGIRHVERSMDLWNELGSQARAPRQFNRPASQPATGKQMQSRYPGRCSKCGQFFPEGTEIWYDFASKKASHIECPQRDEPTFAQVQEREPEPVASTPADTGKPAIREGIFTVVIGGEYRTFRVHSPKQGNFVGKTILSYLSGRDNTGDYTGCAFVSSTGVNMWKRFRDDSTLRQAINVLLDPEAASQAGLAYALESGHCCICGRLLTVPASISMGMGPECASKN